MSEQAAEQQATATAQRVAALYAAYRAGQIDAHGLTRAVSVATYSGKVLATRYADILVSTLANARPLGLVPGEQHLDRLSEAAQTILTEADESDDEPAEAQEAAAERFERLAVAEVLASHRKTLHAAIREQGFQFWQRVVEPDACEKCEPFRDEIQAVAIGFRDHPGCRCSLRPYGEPVPIEQPPVREEPARIITMTRTINAA